MIIWINYRLLAGLSVIIHDSGLGKGPTAYVPKKGAEFDGVGWTFLCHLPPHLEDKHFRRHSVQGRSCLTVWMFCQWVLGKSWISTRRVRLPVCSRRKLSKHASVDWPKPSGSIGTLLNVGLFFFFPSLLLLRKKKIVSLACNKDVGNKLHRQQDKGFNDLMLKGCDVLACIIALLIPSAENFLLDVFLPRRSPSCAGVPLLPNPEVSWK